MFTFYIRALKRAFPEHGNEHVLAGRFEQKGPGQGKGPSASPGEKPFLPSWATVVAEAVGARQGLIHRVSTLQAYAAAALLLSREMGSVPRPISVPFGKIYILPFSPHPNYLTLCSSP